MLCSLAVPGAKYRADMSPLFSSGWVICACVAASPHSWFGPVCSGNSGSLGMARVWSEVPAVEVSQLRGSPSHPRDSPALPCGSPSDPHGSPSLSRALHHFPCLSITPHGALHHTTLPFLSLYFMSCSSSLLQVCSPCPAHLPAVMCADPGPRRACGTPRPCCHTLLMASLWVVASLDPGLQPPTGVTSSPNQPLWWHPRCLVLPCLSPQQSSTLQITLFRVTSPHGEPWPNTGLISILVGPWPMAMEMCRNCIGSAVVSLGWAGAGSCDQAVMEC